MTRTFNESNLRNDRKQKRLGVDGPWSDPESVHASKCVDKFTKAFERYVAEVSTSNITKRDKCPLCKSTATNDRHIQDGRLMFCSKCPHTFGVKR